MTLLILTFQLGCGNAMAEFQKASALVGKLKIVIIVDSITHLSEDDQESYLKTLNNQRIQECIEEQRWVG